ncbi:PIG-U-domain-containing protein [Lentinus tigrinus ALCF2SS1-7]|uniref:PIG-U-domain-containing protein n=1 Tax=Lentinus tigrinus ALCF2SS1-6 TaxID=1328759 RepID=A0A5C2SL95_9APHY|nr:PIG-U-domain-containing protein [Lentinus tigrinus ALCF2SS1-6]RPD78006.1 PIG-U-domain-containing protein [Lentinus tigrinus ALCF2SS1-7]
MDGPDLTFSALVAARLLLAYAPLPEALKHDHQLSSPLTSYSRLREGIYLFEHGIDPYSGGSFRHSPLLLSLFSTVLPLTPYTSPLLWTAADAVAAWALVRIWRLRTGAKTTSRDGQVAAMYLLNPYIFLPSLALSSSSIESALALLALMFACRGRASASLLTLACLWHLSLPSLLLLAPILLLLITRPVSRLALPQPLGADLKRTLPLLAEFSAYSMLLTFASTLVCGNWDWVEKTWGASLTLPDLTPNPGLWWYFFTEMFDHFRPFFLMVFSVHLLIYIVPICVKFQHDFLYAAFVLIGVLALFKPYPTLSDPGLFISMFSLFPEIYPYLRHPIVTALIHLHASLLLPLFNSLWLRQGTGNANFFYASTLVFGVGNGAALLDAIWAGLRIAIGKVEDGYEVVQE